MQVCPSPANTAINVTFLKNGKLDVRDANGMAVAAGPSFKEKNRKTETIKRLDSYSIIEYSGSCVIEFCGNHGCFTVPVPC